MYVEAKKVNLVIASIVLQLLNLKNHQLTFTL